MLFAGKASDLCVKFRREFYEPSVARVSPPSVLLCAEKAQLIA